MGTWVERPWEVGSLNTGNLVERQTVFAKPRLQYRKAGNSEDTSCTASMSRPSSIGLKLLRPQIDWFPSTQR
eukprot:6183936-Pleurochrysis_carterae.AAC.4